MLRLSSLFASLPLDLAVRAQKLAISQPQLITPRVTLVTAGNHGHLDLIV